MYKHQRSKQIKYLLYSIGHCSSGPLLKKYEILYLELKLAEWFDGPTNEGTKEVTLEFYMELEIERRAEGRWI